MNDILGKEVEVKDILAKSRLPVGGYSANPYVGCARMQVLLRLLHEEIHGAH